MNKPQPKAYWYGTPMPGEWRLVGQTHEYYRQLTPDQWIVEHSNTKERRVVSLHVLREDYGLSPGEERR